MRIRNKKGRNGENVSKLDVLYVFLDHCNFINGNYQRELRFLYIFVPKKDFVKLLEIISSDLIFLKIFRSEFPVVDIWHTD